MSTAMCCSADGSSASGRSEYAAASSSWSRDETWAKPRAPAQGADKALCAVDPSLTAPPTPPASPVLTKHGLPWKDDATGKLVLAQRANLVRTERDVRLSYLRQLGVPLPLTRGERRLWSSAPPSSSSSSSEQASQMPHASSLDVGSPPTAEKLKDHNAGNILNKLRRVISGANIEETAVLTDGNAAASAAAAAIDRKRVKFSDRVDVKRIPKHSEYSERVRSQYWASAHEIQGMAYRNTLEFELEGFTCEGVYEEHEMALCEQSGNFVHPLYFVWQLQGDDEAAAAAGAGSMGLAFATAQQLGGGGDAGACGAFGGGGDGGFAAASLGSADYADAGEWWGA
ncbi:unnamed protein product [Phaeothamnion confervicola]